MIKFVQTYFRQATLVVAAAILALVPQNQAVASYEAFPIENPSLLDAKQSDTIALIVASRKTENEAYEVIERFLKKGRLSTKIDIHDLQVNLFTSTNGWLGISIEIFQDSKSCNQVKTLLIDDNLIPTDSYCSNLDRFVGAYSVALPGAKYYAVELEKRIGIRVVNQNEKNNEALRIADELESEKSIYKSKVVFRRNDQVHIGDEKISKWSRLYGACVNVDLPDVAQGDQVIFSFRPYGLEKATINFLNDKKFLTPQVPLKGKKRPNYWGQENNISFTATQDARSPAIEICAQNVAGRGQRVDYDDFMIRDLLVKVSETPKLKSRGDVFNTITETKWSLASLPCEVNGKLSNYQRFKSTEYYNVINGKTNRATDGKMEFFTVDENNRRFEARFSTYIKLTRSAWNITTYSGQLNNDGSMTMVKKHQQIDTNTMNSRSPNYSSETSTRTLQPCRILPQKGRPDLKAVRDSVDIAEFNSKEALSYYYCQSRVTNKYFVKINGVSPDRFFYTYRYNPAKGELDLEKVENVLVYGEQKDNNHNEIAVFSTRESESRLSKVSDGRLTVYKNLQSVEDSLPSLGDLEIDAGTDEAFFRNEKTGASDSFTCSVIAISNSRQRDYVEGIFNRYKDRLGIKSKKVERRSLDLFSELEGAWLLKDDNARARSCKASVPLKGLQIFTYFKEDKMVKEIVFGKQNACHGFAGGCKAVFPKFPVIMKHSYSQSSDKEFSTVYKKGACIVSTSYKFLDTDTLESISSVGDSCSEAAKRAPRLQTWYRCSE